MASTASHSDLGDGDHCFFGKISGDEAANILIKAGAGEGTWLVRESVSSPGNYVLSVIIDDQPQHILIHRHTSDDAVFSLVISETSTVFHGLDTLIQHYCTYPLRPPPNTSVASNIIHGTNDLLSLNNSFRDASSVGTAAQTDASYTGNDLLDDPQCAPYTLRQPCYQDPLPGNTRLHGSSNLLHRAVHQGNVVVVQELLQSGYRKVDARNPDGLTALHLACLTARVDVVQALLDAGAKVRVRDTQGLSPLHYVCRLNKVSVLSVLVEHDPACVQWRVPSNAEVALHEAAASRSVSCVAALLALGAPARPRNTDGQTPAQLATMHHAPNIATVIDSHKALPVEYKIKSYLHGALSRDQCHVVLLGAEQTIRTNGGQQMKAGDSSAVNNLVEKENASPEEPNYSEPCSSSSLLEQHSPTGSSRLKNTAGVQDTVDTMLDFDGSEREEQQLEAAAAALEASIISNRTEVLTVFLVRSSTRIGRHVLSLRHDGATLHFEILSTEDGSYCIDDGPLFPCVEQLVDHYTRFQDGLPALLTHPVPPDTSVTLNVPSATDGEKTTAYSPSGSLLSLLRGVGVGSRQQMPLPVTGVGGARLDGQYSVPRDNLLLDLLAVPEANDTHGSGSSSGGVSPMRAAGSGGPTSSALLTSFEAAGGSCTPTLDGNRTSEICGRIDSSSLTVGETLGVGEFGAVLRGQWCSPAGDTISVAVKTLHSTTDETSRAVFLQEASLMMNLNHPYIVKLLGMCHGPPLAMVQELAPMGALLDHLLDHAGQIQPAFHLKLWPAQVALGMQYLEQKRFVHRDLACRNLLLSSSTLVKITDFGLSRATGANTDYYTASHGGKWPLKWYAPESINYGRFTHSSDVWSYGVTLWEMYTYGDQPYGDLPGYKVVDLLERGERLPQPDGCSAAVYGLMLRCWHLQPNSRPSFQALARHFSTGRDYVDVKPYLKTKG